MKALKLLAAVSALAIPVAVSAVPANAVTLSGTLPQVCTVFESATGVNLFDTNSQRVATLNVVCNKATSPTLQLTATNGVFKHNTSTAFDLDYTVGYDLAGTIGNNGIQTPMVNLAAGGTIGAVGLAASTELAAGVTGVLEVDLVTTAFVAGTYSETLTFTIN